MQRQIILKDIEKPKEKDPNEDISWVVNSFGLSAGRDIDRIANRIISDLLENMAVGKVISSELIAEDLEISPSRVNHHVRNFAESGLVFRERKYIFLRGGSLKSAIAEIRKDANRILDELEQIAEEIDNAMGLRNR